MKKESFSLHLCSTKNTNKTINNQLKMGGNEDVINLAVAAFFFMLLSAILFAIFAKPSKKAPSKKPKNVNGTETETETKSSSKKKMSGKAIAMLVLMIVFLLVFVGLIWWYVVHKKKKAALTTTTPPKKVGLSASGSSK